MRILHYSLGLPPYRSGGLTKYSTDLLLAQSEKRLTVSLLYPGDFTFWKYPKKKIKQCNEFQGIKVFKIINPSPVSLHHGVKSPNHISQPQHKLSDKNLKSFYNKIRPDIFHVHTLMGLPFELLEFLKRKNVKIIFTTHDYYGLCLKTNFINSREEVCFEASNSKCSVCNANAPSSLVLRLKNSNYLLRLKNSRIKRFSTYNAQKNNAINISISEKNVNNYGILINYYKKIFHQMDLFHFNSELTAEIYKKFLPINSSNVIPLSHSGISDHRIEKKFNSNEIRLAFIGNLTTYKGFELLKKVLIALEKNYIINWSLQVWWGGIKGVDNNCNKISYMGKYSENNLEEIYHNIDLLIVPSIWYETLSLTTLEAISFGTPVLVSENVGAKFIVNEYKPDFIFKISEVNLYEKLFEILRDPSILEHYNKKILSKEFSCQFSDHLKKIDQLYSSVIKIDNQ